MKAPDPNYRDDAHIDAVLAAVRAAWTRGDNRYLRLGQLVSNLGYPTDSFYLPDHALVRLCEERNDG